MRKGLIWVLALCLALSLAACGGNKNITVIPQTNPATEPSAPVTTVPPTTQARELQAGYYVLQTVSYDEADLHLEYADIVEMGMASYLLMDTDGTGMAYQGGETADMTWTPDGDMTIQGQTDTFTVSDSVITVNSEGVLMTFVYVGEALPDDFGVLPEESAPQVSVEDRVGYYILSGAKDGDDVISQEEMEAAGGYGYAVLLEDGVGYMHFMGDETVLEWDADYLYADGEGQPYEMRDGVLVLVSGDMEVYFTYSEETPPAPNVELP